MKTTRTAVAAIVALAAGVGGYLAYTALGTNAKAPSVAYTLLDGRTASTGDLRGKVVLVNFWATDCAPCVKEMPQFAALHDKFKSRGLETLAVAMRHDPPALVINFAQSRQLPFGVVIDNTGAFAKSFDEVQVTPTTVLINKRGEIVKRVVGEVDFASLNALVEKLLADA